MTINKVFISGNLASDCEKHGSEKNPVVLFTVAVNERFYVDDEAEERTHWIDCKIFGNYAKALAPSLKKGARVTVEGSLDQSKWQDDEGNNHSKLSVKCANVEISAAREKATEEKEENKVSKKTKKNDKKGSEW